MAVSFISSASAASNTVTMPSHQAGDLIVVYAYRDGSTTSPTMPSGYSSLATGGSNSNSETIAYRYAQSNSETTGTWTNATGIVVHVYRDASVGTFTTNGGSSNSMSYPAISGGNMYIQDGSSWIARFSGHRTATDMVTNTPSGFVPRTVTTTEIRGMDTNSGSAGVSSQTQSVNASSGWRTASVEIMPIQKSATLIDDFNDNSIDTSRRWYTFGSVSETSGVAQMSLTGASPNYHGYYSQRGYDLRDSYLVAEVVNAGNQAWASIEVELQALLNGSGDNRVFMVIANGTLIAYRTVNGTTTSLATIAYNSTTMRWLRIRESGGTTYWEYTSTANWATNTWTTLFSQANPISMIGVFLEIDAGNWSTETGTTTAQWDNFNIVSKPPTVSLDTTDGSLLDNVVLDFTGSDSNGNDITYELEITKAPPVDAYDITPLDAELQFDSVANNKFGIAKLSDTRVIIAWQNSTTVKYVQTFEVNRTTGELTANGSPLNFYSTSIQWATTQTPSITTIDDTHFAIFWAGGDSDGFCRTFQVDSGTGAVTAWGSQVEYDTTQGLENSSILVYSDGTNARILNTWQGADNDGFASIFTVTMSTGVIAVTGTPFEFDTSFSRNGSLSKISDTKVLITYSQSTGYSRVLNINNSTWAVTGAGSAYQWGTDTIFGNSVDIISTSPLIALNAYHNNQYNIRPLSIDDSTWAITNLGSVYNVDSGTATQGQKNLLRLDDTHFITWNDESVGQGRVQTYSFNQSTGDITLLDAKNMGTSGKSTTNDIASVDMGDGLFVTAWVESNFAQYLRAYRVIIPEPSVSFLSSIDSGFLNTVNGGDTDPFTSGEMIRYTSPEEFEPGEYLWRVRGLDPSGTNTWGEWSAFYSFELSENFVFEGNSDMSVSGERVLYDSADIEANSDMQSLSGYIVGYDNVDIEGTGSFTADRIVFDGTSDIDIDGVVNPQTSKRTYLYKIFDSDWNYLGIWTDVISEFGYSHEINSAGSAINVTLARNSDTREAVYDVIADDEGDPIITDDDNEISAELKTIANIGPGTNVDLNLNVRVYEFSDDNQDVEGELVFTGYISKYVSKYGSEENTQVTLFSYGADLDNWVYEDTDGNTRIPFFSEDPSQILRDMLDKFNDDGGIPSYVLGEPAYIYVTNLIQNPSLETNATGWTVALGNGARTSASNTFAVGSWGYSLINSGGGQATYTTGNLIAGQTYNFSYYARKGAESTIAEVEGTNGGNVMFTNSSITHLTPMTTRYDHTFVALENAPLVIDLYVAPSDGIVYIDGLMLTRGSTLYPYFDGSTSASGDFTYSWNGTAHASTSQRAELVGYNEGSIEDTGWTASYEFNVNTGLDVIKASLKLAPTDWYWYYDMANNLVHFHPKALEPAHTFYLGKHVMSLNLEQYIEDLTNTVYYIGGELEEDEDAEKMSFEYLGNASSGTDASTYTYTSQNLGPVAENKAIIVVAFGRISGSPITANSITVDGQTATKVAEYTNNSAGTPNTITIAIARVPDSSTGNVVVNWSGTAVRSGISLYRAVGLQDITPYDVKSSTATNPNTTLAVPKDGIAIGAGMSASAASATWSGLTENFDIQVETNTNMSTASADYNVSKSAVSMTYTPAASNQQLGVFISWKLKELPTKKLYGKYEDATSISTWRRGTKIMSDERVKIKSSMDLIAETEIDRGKNPRYRSSITISGATYPIRNIKLGDLIAFRNFDNFIDEIEMQVVRIDRSPDSVTLQLDTLLPSVPKRLEELKRNLDQAEASNVPDEPLT